MYRIEENGFELQRCPDCNEYLPQESFFPSNWGKNGMKCKACAKAYYSSPKGRAILYKSQRKYQLKNPHKIKEWAANYRNNHRDKYNERIYEYMRNNVDNVMDSQLKYQSKLPSGVYAIKYVDDVIYVGATKHPIRRVNTHMSTIKTSNNITKVNKLFSFLGYDKNNFTWELVEECDPENLFVREKHYQKQFKSKANYKKHFGKVESTKSIIERLGLTTKPRNKWR